MLAVPYVHLRLIFVKSFSEIAILGKANRV